MKPRYTWSIFPSMTKEEFDPLRRYGPYLAKLLYNRGCRDDETAADFLTKTGSLYDPSLMRNLADAAAIIVNAAKNGRKIAVFGDYDCDGVTASAIMLHLLRALGAVDPVVYLPDRFSEGYGVNKDAIDKLLADGVSLIVTVDCGIRSVDEAAYAKSKGIDFIVTDHHEPGDTLPACLVVDAKQPGETYPDKNLAGCGVAYKIAEYCYKNGIVTALDFPYISACVTVGTIADVVPLIGENRSIVRKGLERFHMGKYPLWFDAIAEESGFDPRGIHSTDIAFSVAPRINAAGRMDSAQKAFDLLTCDDPQEAQRLAAKLGELNGQRQAQTDQALKQVAAMSVVSPVLCTYDSSFGTGIVGLIAGRLTEKYYRPSVVGTLESGMVRASCRSIPEVNIVATLEKCGGLLEKYGGHAMAAGLTVRFDKWDDFTAALNTAVAETVDLTELNPTLKIDMDIPSARLRPEYADKKEWLEPFGCDNPEPLIAVRRLKILEAKAMGKTGTHLRMDLMGENGLKFHAISFGHADWLEDLHNGDLIDCACCIENNNFRGINSVQLNVKDVRLSTAKGD